MRFTYATVTRSLSSFSGEWLLSNLIKGSPYFILNKLCAQQISRF